MICDECLHQWECWDQRGLCNQFKSKEELRRQIESINQKYRTAGRSGTDEGSVQETGDLQQLEAPCQYKPKPAPIPKRTPKPKPKKKLTRGYKREVHQQPRFWTAEREQELAELYQEGTTIDQIAIYFDKAQSVISKRIEDMIDRGVIKRRRPLNAWPQEDLDLMYEMRMQGKTFGEIADRLGRSYKACTEQFRRIYG